MSLLVRLDYFKALTSNQIGWNETISRQKRVLKIQETDFWVLVFSVRQFGGGYPVTSRMNKITHSKESPILFQQCLYEPRPAIRYGPLPS